MFWHDIEEVFNQGIKEYLNSSKNILNSTTNILYLTSYFLKFYTMIVVRMNKSKVQDQKYWLRLISTNCTDENLLIDAYNTIYWLNSSMILF